MFLWIVKEQIWVHLTKVHNKTRLDSGGMEQGELFVSISGKNRETLWIMDQQMETLDTIS